MKEDLLLDIYQGTTSKGKSLMTNLCMTEKRYSGLQEISSGGMKSIYSCTDSHTDRDVVLMTPKDESLNEIFVREARINAFLQHPNISPVYDIGLLEKNKPFFTSKLINGKPLSELKLANQTDKIVDIVIKICEAVSYAHSHSIIHQDLKPDNVMIDDFGEVIIIDWGLAEIDDSQMKGESSILDKDTENLLLYSIPEEQRKLRGTPGFIHPDRYEKYSVGSENDIYSIGALLYYLLTETKPEQPKSDASAFQQTFEKQTISPGLKAICQKALSTSKNHIYKSVNEMLEDLILYRNGFATNAESASFLRLLRLLYERNRQLCLIGMAASAIIIIITAVSFLQVNQSRDRALQEKANAEESNSKNLRLLEELKEKEISRQEYMKLNARNQLIILNDLMNERKFHKVPELLEFTEELDPQNKEVKLFRAEYELGLLNWQESKEKFKEIQENKTLSILNDIDPQKSSSILEHMEELSKCISRDAAYLFAVNNLIKFKDLKIRQELFRWVIYFNHKGMKILPNVSIEEIDGKIKLKVVNHIAIRYAGPVHIIDPHIVDFSNTNVHSIHSLQLCTRLEELNLTNATIVSLSSFTFPKLKKLNLSKTSIKNIFPETFPNLEVLDISNAFYQQYKRFKHYPKLKELIVDKRKYEAVKHLQGFKITVKE